MITDICIALASLGGVSWHVPGSLRHCLIRRSRGEASAVVGDAVERAGVGVRLLARLERDDRDAVEEDPEHAAGLGVPDVVAVVHRAAPGEELGVAVEPRDRHPRQLGRAGVGDVPRRDVGLGVGDLGVDDGRDSRDLVLENLVVGDDGGAEDEGGHGERHDGDGGDDATDHGKPLIRYSILLG